MSVRWHEFETEFVSSCLSWGGNTLLAGLPERLQMEIRHVVPADLMESVSVTSPSDRDFSVWCGGAVLASLPVLSSAWISSDEYQEFGPQIVFRKCFWSFVIQRCRIEKSGGVVFLNIPACWILNDVTTRQHISLVLSLRLTNTKTLLKTLNNIGCINQIFFTIWYIYSKCYVKVLYLCGDNSVSFVSNMWVDGVSSESLKSNVPQSVLYRAVKSELIYLREILFSYIGAVSSLFLRSFCVIGFICTSVTLGISLFSRGFCFSLVSEGMVLKCVWMDKHGWRLSVLQVLISVILTDLYSIKTFSLCANEIFVNALYLCLVCMSVLYFCMCVCVWRHRLLKVCSVC